MTIGRIHNRVLFRRLANFDGSKFWKIYINNRYVHCTFIYIRVRSSSSRLSFTLDQASCASDHLTPPRPKLLPKETLSSPPVLTIPHVLSKLSQLLPCSSNPFYPPSLLKTFSNYTRIRVENPYSSSAEVKLRKFDREAGNNFARFEDGILNRRERQLSTSYERLSWFWRRLDLSNVRTWR